MPPNLQQPGHGSNLNVHHREVDKEDVGDFPGAPMFKNLTCNAEDKGSISGGEAKIPRAQEQLSPHAALGSSGTTRMLWHRTCHNEQPPQPNNKKKNIFF